MTEKDTKETKPKSLFSSRVSLAFFRTFVLAACVLAFGGGMWKASESIKAFEFFTIYQEQMKFAIEHLFALFFILDGFDVPAPQQDRLIFFGLYLAIPLKVLAVLFGAEMLVVRTGILLFFAALFLIGGPKLLLSKDHEETDRCDNMVVKGLRAALPITEHFEDDNFFVVLNGKHQPTPLIVALLALEGAEFALGLLSVPELMTLSEDHIVVLGACVAATLTLRSVYVLLLAGVTAMPILRRCCGLIVVLLGGKLLLEFFQIRVSILVTLVTVVVVLGGGVWINLLRTKTPPKEEEEEEQDFDSAMRSVVATIPSIQENESLLPVSK